MRGLFFRNVYYKISDAFSNESERHHALNLLEMIVQSEYGAGVLLGYYRNIAVEERNRFPSFMGTSFFARC